MPLENIFRTRRNLKYSTYLETAKARRASFSPFIATCDAVLDNEAEGYLKRLAVVLSEKWGSSYCRVVGWLRARVQIYAYCDQSACVLEETEQSLGELELTIMQDYLAWILIFRDFLYFSYYVFFSCKACS